MAKIGRTDFLETSFTHAVYRRHIQDSKTHKQVEGLKAEKDTLEQHQNDMECLTSQNRC